MVGWRIKMEAKMDETIAVKFEFSWLSLHCAGLSAFVGRTVWGCDMQGLREITVFSFNEKTWFVFLQCK